jgi:hypothetical protein
MFEKIVTTNLFFNNLRKTLKFFNKKLLSNFKFIELFTSLEKKKFLDILMLYIILLIKKIYLRKNNLKINKCKSLFNLFFTSNLKKKKFIFRIFGKKNIKSIDFIFSNNFFIYFFSEMRLVFSLDLLRKNYTIFNKIFNNNIYLYTSNLL